MAVVPRRGRSWLASQRLPFPAAQTPLPASLGEQGLPPGPWVTAGPSQLSPQTGSAGAGDPSFSRLLGVFVTRSWGPSRGPHPRREGLRPPEHLSTATLVTPRCPELQSSGGHGRTCELTSWPARCWL